MSLTVQKQQTVDALLDSASAVFARHGFDRASIQTIADATGYSKAGLLHHFPSKQAIFDAALAQCRVELQRIFDRVAPVQTRPDKDRYAVKLLVDLALDRPGLVALLLTGTTPLGADNGKPEFLAITADLFNAFDVAEGSSNTTRYLQVLGALSVLSVLSLNAHELDHTTAWRDDIVRISLAALGYPA